mgnify:CR=1 FL=1
MFPTPHTIKTNGIELEVFAKGSGKAVVMCHGWPEHAYSWRHQVDPLVDAGYQVIVPNQRGYGHSSRPTPVDEYDITHLKGDLVGLLDNYGLDDALFVGHDWGARAAYIASCLAPERFTHCVALSVGWGTNDPEQVLSLTQAQNYWYHWYMTLPRGEALVRDERRVFTRYIWKIWTPDHPLSDAAFDATAPSFDNPDWAEIVMHSYRVRWGFAEVDPTFESIEARLRSDPTIAVPTLVIHGGADPCNTPSNSEGKEHLFSGTYRREILEGVGHFPQREMPQETVALIVPFLVN